MPQTSPQIHGDLSMWAVNAINKLEGTLSRVETSLSGLQAQMTRMEAKVDDVKDNVGSHDKWVHTLKVLLTGASILISIFVTYLIGPWIKAKFGLPAGS
jgi:hypothetical protein